MFTFHLCFKQLQGYSGTAKVDPCLVDNGYLGSLRELAQEVSWLALASGTDQEYLRPYTLSGCEKTVLCLTPKITEGYQAGNDIPADYFNHAAGIATTPKINIPDRSPKALWRDDPSA